MKIFINNAKDITLYELYSIKHYHISIINSIIILRVKLFKLAHGSSI